jgi:CBS domain containing-hemolysin-like protein
MPDPHPLLGSSEIGWRLLLVIGLILINAFFVTTEFAIFSVRRSRITQLVASGDNLAKKVQDLQRGIERLLSTTQLGITLSSLALGWIGERAIAQILTQSVVNSPIAHSLSILITFSLLAYLQIVFGELIPKSIALIYAEPIAKFLGTPSLAIARIFSPIIWILDRSTRLCLRLLGIKDRDDYYSRVTFKELQTIVTTERESSGLALEQRELLNKVFEFAEVVAAEVMIPRTQMVTIPQTATCQTLLLQVAATGYSRYPVTDKSLNKIVGTISFKDFAPLLAQGKPAGQIPIQEWIQPVDFVTESTPLSVVLNQMQTADTEMTIVVDEFGNTAGSISRQDAIAEMIGIKVTSNRPTTLLHQLTDGAFLVQAQIHLEDLNEQLGTNLPLADDYQTLAGFLLNKLQQFPKAGESLTHNDWNLTVVSTIGPRIHQVRMQRLGVKG